MKNMSRARLAEPASQSDLVSEIMDSCCSPLLPVWPMFRFQKLFPPKKWRF
jgi:hypothetical protein